MCTPAYGTVAKKSHFTAKNAKKGKIVAEFWQAAF
jgi:hypothetical protein